MTHNVSGIAIWPQRMEFMLDRFVMGKDMALVLCDGMMEIFIKAIGKRDKEVG